MEDWPITGETAKPDGFSRRKPDPHLSFPATIGCLQETAACETSAARYRSDLVNARPFHPSNSIEHEDHEPAPFYS
jgi:hypothetical protein